MGDIIEELAKRGGVSPKRAIADAGFSTYAIGAAVESRRLISPRRGWVALPDADPYLVAAARAGVVLTCITRAKRLGLWVRSQDGPHVGVAPNASRLDLQNDTTVVHWANPVQQREPGALEDGILNTLAIVAECQPHEDALAVWNSALNAGLVDRQELSRLPLRPAARRLLEEATPFADSGLETYFVTRLKWLRLPIRVQIWIHGHRADALVGDRLVVQIDGGHHVGAQRAEDIAHDAALMLLGYHVIRVTYSQIVDGWHQVQDLIMRAVAQGLHKVR
ncbi:endonuclease domain-containing protein [Microbacterium kyungheense]|uniref:endonuclease domain-containing protein n=1 Tax=Microbacterium kyungheense TaxID=1263636 RepID=UPI001FE962C0|nr:DUF559 domain-containing protein [Microbacterium kyungheense]